MHIVVFLDAQKWGSGQDKEFGPLKKNLIMLILTFVNGFLALLWVSMASFDLFLAL